MKKLFFISAISFLCFTSFSQNSRRFLLNQDKESFSVYKPSGKNPELVIQEGTGNPNILMYSNDGKYLMCGSDSEANVFELENCGLIKKFVFSDLNFKNFSPDCKYLVCISHDNNIVLINIETREETIIGKEKDDYSRECSFSYDGKLLAFPNSDCIDIYEIPSGKKKSILSKSGYLFYDQIAWTDDNHYLSILATKQKGIMATINIVYDLKNEKIVKIFDEGKYNIYKTAITPDAKYVAYALSEDINVKSVFSDDIKKKFRLPDEFSENTYGAGPTGFDFMQNGRILHVQKEFGFCQLDLTNWLLKTSGKDDWVMLSFAAPKFNADEFAIGYPKEIIFFNSNVWDETGAISGSSHITNLSYDYENNQCFVLGYWGEETALLGKDFVPLPKSENLTKKILGRRVAYTTSGEIYSDYDNKNISLRIIDTNEDKVILNNVNADTIIANSDGSLIAGYDDVKKSAFLYNVNKRIYSKLPGIGDFFIDSSCFSHNSKYIYFNECDNSMIVYDINNKNIVQKIKDSKGVNGNGSFSFDDKFFAKGRSYSLPDIAVEIYDTKTWKIIKQFKKTDALNTVYSKAFFSKDNQFIGLKAHSHNTGLWYIHLYSVPDWKFVKEIQINNNDSEFVFNSDGSKIIALNNAGIINCYSVSNGNLLVSFAFGKNDDWLTYTPEGYFTGSPNGINKFVRLVDGMQVFELGQLYDTLYRPDLVQEKLNENFIGRLLLKDIVASGNAPLVQFTKTPLASSRNVKLEFSVQDTGGGVGYVYLSHNGKAMQVSAREESKTGRKYIYSCDVTLTKGENIFEAYAFNSTNKIESHHTSTKLDWQGLVEKSNLYVLAMGVDKYKYGNALQYSVADTNAIIESFKLAPGGVYSTVNVMSLLDYDVNTEKIQSAFNALSEKVKPDDVFVFYIAGHGVADDGEYYFIPYDFNGNFETQGISKHFLMENLTKINAMNSIVILDTCFSGSFIDEKQVSNSLSQSTALEHLAHTSGQVILTASSNAQEANEGYKGHGFFTYVMLDALSGKANYDGTSNVSIRELATYLKNEVPALCVREKKKVIQNPWISKIQGDFSVVATGNKKPSEYYVLNLDGNHKPKKWVSVRIDDSY